MAIEEIGLEDRELFLGNDSTDPSSIKFSDKKVSFNGLSKEEIMKYSNDPQWVKLRWFLHILFWVIWFSMLTSAVLIVIYTPHCAFKPKQVWWQKEAIYQLDIEFFKDSNNDGVGDLPGLLSKLSYFKTLGVKTLCLRENLIDDTNPKQVSSGFGDEGSLRALKKALDSRDMHLILDIPYSRLETNAQDTLKHWLTSFVDGVRITSWNESETIDTAKFDEWVKLANQIYETTFKPKFITLYPLKNSQSLNPSLRIDNSFLNIQSEDVESQAKFIAKISKISNDSSSVILGDFESKRVKTSLGPIFTKLPLYHGLTLLLKGTPIILYGDELEFDDKQKLMKWDSSVGCGFSGNSSFAGENCHLSIRDSFSYGSDESLALMYKSLLKLREEPSFCWGDLTVNNTSVEENVISFVRNAQGFDIYLIAANTDKSRDFSIDFKSRHQLPSKATVAYFYSTNGNYRKSFELGTLLETDNIRLKSGEFLVLKFKV